MPKKRSTDLVPANGDIQMYSGIVRIYEGPGYQKPLEDMCVERFPATSKSNAHLFLINAARQWLEENGQSNSGGMEIVYCDLDEAPKSKPVPASKPAQTSKPEGSTPPPAASTYAAFKCHIVSLCKERFVGKYDTSCDTLMIEKEK